MFAIWITVPLLFACGFACQKLRGTRLSGHWLVLIPAVIVVLIGNWQLIVGAHGSIEFVLLWICVLVLPWFGGAIIALFPFLMKATSDSTRGAPPPPPASTRETSDRK